MKVLLIRKTVSFPESPPSNHHLFWTTSQGYCDRRKIKCWGISVTSFPHLSVPFSSHSSLSVSKTPLLRCYLLILTLVVLFLDFFFPNDCVGHTFRLFSLCTVASSFRQLYPMLLANKVSPHLQLRFLSLSLSLSYFVLFLLLVFIFFIAFLLFEMFYCFCFCVYYLPPLRT